MLDWLNGHATLLSQSSSGNIYFVNAEKDNTIDTAKVEKTIFGDNVNEIPVLYPFNLTGRKKK